MAFSFITKSKGFHKLNSSLQGRIIIERWKRRVFSFLYLCIDDIQWQKIQYKKAFHKELDLSNPEYVQEKILYLKLFYQNPMLHVCTDKHFVQDYVKMNGLEYILLPEIAVFNSAEEMDFDVLPEKFVVKCSQGSGGNLIIDKMSPDYSPEKIRLFFKELLKTDYYKVGREYGYKGVTPRVICQPFLRNSDGSDLIDYKFYCFDGVLKYYMVSYGEFKHNVRNHKFDRYNRSIDYIFKKESTLAETEVQLPDNIEEMKEVAEKLSKPFPHVRVDLFSVDGKIYFGELTFYSNGGFINIFNEDAAKKMGCWIPLEKYRDDMIFNKKTKKYIEATNVSD